MRFFAVLCAIVAIIGALVTAAVLGLALVPQESSGPATGDWGWALLPGVASVAFGWLAVALWRESD